MIDQGSRKALACVAAGLIAVALTVNSGPRHQNRLANTTPSLTNHIAIAVSAGPGLRLTTHSAAIPPAGQTSSPTLYCSHLVITPFADVGYGCTQTRIKTARHTALR